MKRTMKVTGKGRLKIKPDMIRILIQLEGVYKNYDEAVLQSTIQTEELRKMFMKIGFKGEDLKTTDFNIDTKYENKDVDGVWTKIFIGYRYYHSLKIEFDKDNALLGRILEAFSKCSSYPEFNIEYTIKDEESAKNELLARAVEDSKKKAEILSRAAGVELGEILAIDYSWGEIQFLSETDTMYGLAKCEAMPIGSQLTDIEPDDIDISDTVTVVWEI